MAAVDESWMRRALERAREAGAEGEVPVGAVLVREGRALAEAGNRPVADHDPTGHAEIRVLREACRAAGNYRLPGAVVYVTLEPCLMCVGALVHARVDRLVFGAPDPKSGAVGSMMDAPALPGLNHRLAVSEGVLARDCGELLREFFRRRRGDGSTPGAGC